MPTGIEWTEETWNPVRARLKDSSQAGWHCTHASEGCRFCYAEVINRRLGTGLDYKPGHEKDLAIYLDDKALEKPLHWKRPRAIFPGSMTDLFADFVTDAMLDEIFSVAAAAPQHSYQFLTKRPDRLLEYARQAMGMGEHWLSHCERSHAPMWPLPNVWLGVSVEDSRVQHRIDTLRKVPVAGAEQGGFRWISFEPLIGRVINPNLEGIHWAVVGGESGHQARFAEGFEAAALEIRMSCLRYGVAYFMKQMTFKKPIPPHMMLREMPA